MSSDHIRKQRRYLKARFTALEKFISSSSESTSVSIDQIQLRLESVREIYQQFQEGNQQLLEIVLDDEFSERDAPENSEFDERYYAILDSLNQLREKCDPTPSTTQHITMTSSTNHEPTPPTDQNSRPTLSTDQRDSTILRLLDQQSAILQHLTLQQNNQPVANDSVTQILVRQQQLLERLSANTSNAHNSAVKLPIIKLPTFDGNIEEWKKFSDSFKTLIHNSDLPPVQKHQYLISALTGSAAKIVESIEISEQNYEVAWNLLVKRFDDERLIRKKHIQCIFDMPTITRESSRSLQDLIDHVQRHLRVLTAMKRPTESLSDLIIHMIESRLDKHTRKVWEEYIENIEDPTTEQIIAFLQRRCQIIERSENLYKSSIQNFDRNQPVKFPNVYKGQSRPNNNITTSLITSTKPGRCFFCEGNHFIYSCDSFLKLSIDDRIKQIKSLKLCINCLKNDHYVKNCKSSGCRTCGQRHNTLCHFAKPTMKPPGVPSALVPSSASGSTSTSPSSLSTQRSDDNINETSSHHVSSANHYSSNLNSDMTLIATALVDGKSGNFHTVGPLRVLLDGASEGNFITLSACKKLNLKLTNACEAITGLNQMSCMIEHRCNVKLSSRVSNFEIEMSCLVVPSITKQLPSAPIKSNQLSIPPNLRLADPGYSKPSTIDALIGAEFFYGILQDGKLKLGEKLFMQNSSFGWLIAGAVPLHLINGEIRDFKVPNHLTSLFTQHEYNDQLLLKFWEIEDYQNQTKSAFSLEEIACENHFQNNVKRDESGRFIVKLPFKPSQELLGNSKAIAIKRFNSIERKFKSNPKFHESYSKFMQEYLDLGHMTKMNDFGPSHSIHLPHHGVFQDSNGISKIRVVFDASAKTETGISLNETLMVGPVLQDNLIYIILRFRISSIAITGDLCKMYRQILVNDSDRDFQRIVWRFNSEEPLQSYQLNTVTYGQSCAPFLAIRCVRELANSEREASPLASHVLLNDIYVDDILTGLNSKEEAEELLCQLKTVLSKAGFSLHKLRSNVHDIVTESAAPDQGEHTSLPNIGNNVMKTLGLNWDTNDDTLHFSINFPLVTLSKRHILSVMSRLFDPLGLISPILIKAKLIMQTTWSANLEWDNPLPEDISAAWNNYVQDLGNIEDIKIPRRVSSGTKPIHYILHAFCDASTKAYGACFYLQVIDSNGTYYSSLLCSKSRVAPVKSKTITLPRLELCGAVVLVRLFKAVGNALKLPFVEIHAWTDSTIVLAWINGDPSHQKPFISNRTAEIQSSLPKEHWHHVRSEDNPADLISRGTTISKLKDNSLWWSGPSWINQPSSHFQGIEPSSLSSDEQVIIRSENKSSIQVYINVNKSVHIVNELLNKHSSLSKIKRIVGWLSRFIYNSRKPKINRIGGTLSIEEIEKANYIVIRAIQADQFKKELVTLSKGNNLQDASSIQSIQSLSPFIDKLGLLRVGGRMHNSTLPYDHKHPILLPADSPYTTLLFREEHIRLSHTGPQALLFSLRETYWPIRGKNLARKVVHECTICTRHSPKLLTQLMGQLPADRVTPSCPFFITGIDFAGPIVTLLYKGRGRKDRKTIKSYIALFICMATKAIHLEAVCDLSTAAFIACLRRFVSRRGCPQKIWSDNGTNFVGASNELREIYEFLVNQHQELNDHFYIPNGITWKFNPPSAPHMGGLWEAGVKSCKYHLKRIMGGCYFTFEELSTALTQIEACLNSRPLCQLPSTPTDFQPLCPGHFLIGGPLTAIPDISVTDAPLNRLDRWQLIQKTVQDFWQKWNREYLTSLQGKTKWCRNQPNLNIDDIVLISDPLAPPLNWRLGRVIELHPESDGKVRVVSLKTATGICKRPLVKLCKLPVNN